MASQVLSGTGNVSYTNNTGQNVRVIINFMGSKTTTQPGGSQTNEMTISWSGASVSQFAGTGASAFSIGRNLAFSSNTSGGVSANNYSGSSNVVGFPTELMLASGQTFSAICAGYNIVIIPEAG
jgi:hypothetical protein